MRLIIGLVGEKGGGKETFHQLLQKIKPNLTFQVIRFSDTLKDILDILDLPHTRQNLQEAAIMIDHTFGSGTLTSAIKNKIQQINSDIILIDGIRWPTDLELLKSFKNNLLIYITADEQIRFQRIKSRKEKVGEDLISFNQFKEEEQKETEIHIPQIGQQADIIINNNGTLKNLESQIEKLANKFLNHLH